MQILQEQIPVRQSSLYSKKMKVLKAWPDCKKSGVEDERLIAVTT